MTEVQPWRAAVERLAATDDKEELSRLVAVLVNEFKAPVFAVALHFTRGDTALAEDIFQETFIRLIESRRNIRSPVAFPRFLKVVTMNIARDLIRRRSRETVRDSFSDVGDTTESRLFETRLYVQAYLAQLDPRQQDVLVGKFFRGDDDRTIAGKIGESPENVRVLRHRALARLRQLIKEDDL